MTNTPVADLVAVNECIEMVYELYDSVLARKARQELNQALARAAAAAMEMREHIIKWLQNAGIAGGGVGDPLTELLLALPIDPDAQKALDKLLAKAREDSIREAAEVCDNQINPSVEMSDPKDWAIGIDQCRDAILALINDGGRDE